MKILKTGEILWVDQSCIGGPSKTIPIATVAMAHATFVLIISKALWWITSLLPPLPEPIFDNNVHVNKRHRQHAPDSIFGIFVPSEPLPIPFELDGVIASFTTRLPTQAELNDAALHVELTSNVEWIPSAFALSLVKEDSKTDDSIISTLRARRLEVLRSKSNKHRIKSCMRTLETIEPLFEIETANEVGKLDDDPILRSVSALTTNRTDTKVNAIQTGDVTLDVTPEKIAKRWLVGIKTAKKTLNVTTQRGVRSIPNPATRRFKTQMAHLRYPRMGGMFYADIMEPEVLSLES